MELICNIKFIVLLFAGHYFLKTGHTQHLDLSNSNLNTIPLIQDVNIETIDLSRNDISNITSSQLGQLRLLEVLDLSYNKLQKLDKDVFYGLLLLREIDLSFNKLDVSYIGLPKGIFRDQQSSLKVLKLTTTTRIKEWAVESLQTLNSLEELHLNLAPVYDQFPTTLASLPKLRLLNLQCELVRRGLNLTKNWIQPLKGSSVEELSFLGCYITGFEPGVFANFSKLRALSLACAKSHDISFGNITDALSDLGHTPLRTLILDRATRQNTFLHKGYFCNDIGEKISELSIRHNSIGFIEVDSTKCLKLLQKLTIGFDPLFPVPLKSYLDIIPHGLQRFEASFALTTGFRDEFINRYCADRIYSVKDYFHEDDIESSFPIVHHKPKFNVTKPGMNVVYTNNSFLSTKYAYIDNIPNSYILDKIIIFETPSTNEVINATNFGPLTGIFPMFVIFSLPYSRVIDISNMFKSNSKYDLSFLKTLDPYPEYPSLVSLNISGNELSSYAPFLPKLFKNMPRLKELDLSNNGFFKLPIDTFVGLQELKVLKVSNNLLTMKSLIFHASTFQALQHLELAYNRISAMQEKFTDILEELASTQILILNITGNPLQCQCSTLEFINWIQSTNVTIVDNDMVTCDFVMESTNISLGTQYVKDIQISDFYTDCHVSKLDVTLLALIITLTLLMFGAILLCIKCKMRIMVQFYRLRHRGQNILSDDMSEYHIYILYSEQSDNDRQLVVNILSPLLEQEGYRLFFNGKDDIPGHNCYEEIYRGITACQKVIVVVSPHLLQDGMCDFALQVAITELQLQCISLLVYSEINKAQIKKQPLATILQTRFVTRIDINPQELENLTQIKERLKYFASDGQRLQCLG